MPRIVTSMRRTPPRAPTPVTSQKIVTSIDVLTAPLPPAPAAPTPALTAPPGVVPPVLSPGGDLAGTAIEQRVVGLQSRPISSTAPVLGQALTWDGASWTPADPASISVGDIAALTALPLPATQLDGLTVFVRSVLAPWRFASNASALSVDGITIAATSLGGATRWVRMDYSDLVWRLQASWYIDPVNGNDENTGLTGFPLKTWAEQRRRTLRNGVWEIVANSDVYFASYPSENDPLRLDVKFHQLVNPDESGNGPVLWFHAPPFVTVASGTFTAITARNRATNTPWNVVDSTQTDTSTWPLLRCRITSGPRAGARAWVAKSTGVGSWRTSEWVMFSPDGPVGSISRVTPQVGDPYVIEGVSASAVTDHDSLHSDFIRLHPGSPAPFPGACTLFFEDFDFHPAAMNGTLPLINEGGVILMNDCLFKHGEFDVWTRVASGDYVAGYSYFGNCATIGETGGGIGNIVFRSGGYIENYIDAGCFTGQVVAFQAAGAVIEFDALFQGGLGGVPPPSATASGSLCIVTCGVMDWGSYGGALCIDSTIGLSTFFDTDGPALWGTTATAGAWGVTVRPGGKFRYVAGSQITITGPAGDFALGANTVGRAWDDTAGAYTANIACTWANLIGGAGKDNMHNLMEDAHIYLNAGSSWLQGQP